MMAKAQHIRFKIALETKRKELVREIHAHASELVIDRVHDPLDQVQGMTHRDEAVDNVHRLSRTLSSVESSLRAISEGCYGDCEDCGEPIAIKRLEILPWATHCVNCQERLEQLEAARDPRPEEREASPEHPDTPADSTVSLLSAR